MATRVVHNGSLEFTDVLAQVQSLLPSRKESGGYVTIGVFDGVHLGHRRLIARMVEAAHSTGNVAIVLTFDFHPAAVLGRSPPQLLTSVEERAELLASLGVDVLVTLPFTPATARVRVTDLVEALMYHLRLTALWGGPDFAFGYQREGSIPFLRRLGAERGFTVHIVEPLVWEGALVSSSRVRSALQAGDIFQATGCLGRPYRLADVLTLSPSRSYHCPPRCVEGWPQGEEEGDCGKVPAAYVSPPPGRLLPADGVYACLAHTRHLETQPAVANVSTWPTSVKGEMPSDRRRPIVEVHLLDDETDSSDQVLALDFIARLRNERVFSTLGALTAQLYDDTVQARNILAGRDTSRELVYEREHA